MIRTSHLTKSLAALGAVMAIGSADALAASGVERSSTGPAGNPATADYWAGESLLVFTELGKNNNIRIQVNNQGTYFFRDTVDGMVAGNGCDQVSPTIAKCDPNGATQIRVHAFDGKNDITVDDNVMIDTRLSGSGDKLQTIDGGGGRDYIAGGDIADPLSGGPGNDVIDGFGGADEIAGDAGDDLLRGGNGEDKFMAGAQAGLGADTMFGENGTDYAEYLGTLTGVNVTIDDNNNDGAPGEKDNVRKDVENVYGTNYADTIKGDDDANTFYGRDGIDKLFGEGGDDLVNGGNQDDQLHGGNDDDTVSGTSGNDQVDGDAGLDNLYGSSGIDDLDGGKDRDNVYGGPDADKLYGGGGGFDDILDGGTGPDKMDGGPGAGDAVNYGYRLNDVTADLTGSANDDGEAGEGDTIVGTVERVFGGTGNDKLTGNQNINVITGGKGNDTIDVRGAGDDEAFGDDGDDTLLSRDQILDKDTCGNGNDTAIADSLDGVSGDCETVDRGLGGGGQNGGNGGGKGVGPIVQFAKKGTVKKGKTKIKVACPKTAKGACAGMLTLKSGKKTVGTAQFTIKPGKKAKVTIKLAKVLKRGKKMKVKAYALTTDDVSKAATSKGKLKLTFKS